MRRFLRAGLVLAVAACLAVIATGAANGRSDTGAPAGPSCDVQCMRYQTTLYLQAINAVGGLQNIPAQGVPAARFPGLHISPNVVVTNNGSPSTLGAGSVWTHHIVQFQYRQ